MEPQFWHNKWASGQIGFHRSDANPALVRQWAMVSEPLPGTTVWVPLCGKTLDMVYLREQGHPVVGVELSPLATAAFFDEQHLPMTETQDGPYLARTSGEITLPPGNVLDMPAFDTPTLWYDRAATVALPPDLRTAYAQAVARVLPQGSRGLLVVFDYDTSLYDGPPFSIPVDEVQRLYGEAFEILPLDTTDVPGPGTMTLQQRTFLLTRRADG